MLVAQSTLSSLSLSFFTSRGYVLPVAEKTHIVCSLEDRFPLPLSFPSLLPRARDVHVEASDTESLQTHLSISYLRSGRNWMGEEAHTICTHTYTYTHTHTHTHTHTTHTQHTHIYAHTE